MSNLLYKQTPLSTICISGPGPVAPDFPTSPPTSYTPFSNSRPLNVKFLYQNTDISQYYTAPYEYFTTPGANYNRNIGNDYPSNVKAIRVVAVSGGGGKGGEGAELNYYGTKSGGSGGGDGGWSGVSYVNYPVKNGDNISITIGSKGDNGNTPPTDYATYLPQQAGSGNQGKSGNYSKVYLNGTLIAEPPFGNGGNGGGGGRINKSIPNYNRDGKNPGNYGNYPGYYGGLDNNWDNSFFYGGYGATEQNGVVQIILLYGD